MANWKLVEPHYLKIPGVTWRYEEISRSGELNRKEFPVPTLLDPNDPRHYTHRDPDGSGYIVVSDGNNAQKGAKIFEGEPTPGMEPLDKEAEEITAKFSSKWIHPIEGVKEQSYGDAMMAELKRQMDAIQDSAKATSPIAGSADLMVTLQAVLKQNAEILERLVKANEEAKAAPTVARRA